MRSFIGICFLIAAFGFPIPTVAQKMQFDVDYGRAFFYYKVKDDGTGFRNEPPSHHNFIAGLGVRRNVKNDLFIQSGVRFTMYQQYFSTNIAWGVYHDPYPVIHFPLLIGLRKPFRKLAGEISAGPVIALMPDQYHGEFSVRLYRNGSWDSLARGTVLRQFGPVFPLMSISGGIDYRLSSKFTVFIKGTAGWGFRTITRVNVHYNNGSGSNDQTATQWGKGNFSSISVGLRTNFRLTIKTYPVKSGESGIPSAVAVSNIDR